MWTRISSVATAVRLTVMMVVIGVCFGGCWLVGVPSAMAIENNSIRSYERQQLLTQIAFLQAEVARLQALLSEARAGSVMMVSGEVSLYGATFPVEHSYEISSRGTLIPRALQSNDQALFSLWNAVIGTSTTVAKVDRWQIFHDPTTVLGAHVGIRGEQEGWIISVNRAGYEAEQRSEQQSFAELFVHEYAHMLFYDVPDVVIAFEDRFWMVRDYAHSTTVETTPIDEIELVLARYYAKNQTRFVSDYATVNTDEDMAETFLALVFYPASADEASTLAAKQRFLLADPTVAQSVYTIRRNLSRLGLNNF